MIYWHQSSIIADDYIQNSEIYCCIIANIKIPHHFVVYSSLLLLGLYSSLLLGLNHCCEPSV